MVGQSIRCFLAVEIPIIDEYYELSKKTMEETGAKLKVVHPSLYHFTLHFFGELSDDQIDLLKIKCSELFANIDEFSMSLCNTGVFPNNHKRTRILYVDTCRGKEEIINLVKTVRAEIQSLGYEVEKRAYHPHLTVARVKYAKFPQKLAEYWIDKELKNVDRLFNVKRIVLMKSILTPKGPEYSVLAEFPLIPRDVDQMMLEQDD